MYTGINTNHPSPGLDIYAPIPAAQQETTPERIAIFIENTNPAFERDLGNEFKEGTLESQHPLAPHFRAYFGNSLSEEALRKSFTVTVGIYGDPFICPPPLFFCFPSELLRGQKKVVSSS